MPISPGRPKGAPNKIARRATEEVRALFAKKKYNPIEELVKAAQDKNTPPDVKVAIAKELSQYVAPKLKSMDADIKQQTGLTVKLVSFSGNTATPINAKVTSVTPSPQQMLEDEDDD